MFILNLKIVTRRLTTSTRHCSLVWKHISCCFSGQHTTGCSPQRGECFTAAVDGAGALADALDGLLAVADNVEETLEGANAARVGDRLARWRREQLVQDSMRVGRERKKDKNLQDAAGETARVIKLDRELVYCRLVEPLLVSNYTN